MAKILFVEDDEDVSSMMEDLLKSRGLEFVGTSSGSAALHVLTNQTIDLILLDIGLPDQDGFHLCKQIQDNPRNRDIPIIFITGSLDIDKKVRAFKLGADDYIVKPFNTLELLARVEGKLNKQSRQKQAARELIKGPIKINVPNQRVILTYSGREKTLPLTKLEFKLLVLFIENENQILTRQKLINAIWRAPISIGPRTIDAHICSIRRKLGPFSHYIESVMGEGYRFSLKAVKRVKIAA